MTNGSAIWVHLKQQLKGPFDSIFHRLETYWQMGVLILIAVMGFIFYPGEKNEGI